MIKVAEGIFVNFTDILGISDNMIIMLDGTIIILTSDDSK